MRRIGLLLVLLGLSLVALYVALQEGRPLESLLLTTPPLPSTPIPATPTPEPLVPTATIGPSLEASRAATVTVSTTICPLADCRGRAGASGQPGVTVAAYQAGLQLGTYLSWNLLPDPPRPGGADFWQMIKVGPEGPRASWDVIAEALAANQGAIWIVGNEPDVIWQDNLTAEQYASVYHDIYTFVKERDPGARLAVAGVAQPTPLRLTYLDQVLTAYQSRYGAAMPVDVWTVHGFILREEAGSWGVDIPPGLEAKAGRLYEIKDHDDLAIFEQNLLDFRAWMAKHGYHDRPLAMTEFGILLPAEYGFPSSNVAEFLVGALQILATSTSDDGYAPDEGRLVQWWHWYSVYDPFNYPTGNLYDPVSGKLTLLGRVYAAFIGE